jgi:predicted MarR family transcription regulator
LCKGYEKSNSINNLILVTTSEVAESAKKLADICVIFDERDIGKANIVKEGLKFSPA